MGHELVMVVKFYKFYFLGTPGMLDKKVKIIVTYIFLQWRIRNVQKLKLGDASIV